MKKLLYLILIIPQIFAAQYSIKGVFAPANEFTYAFLYINTPSGVNYIDRAKIKTDGSFIIHPNETLEPGIYKIVYATPPEDNNFNFFYNGKEEIDLNFDLELGLSFTSSTENILWDDYLKDISNINTQISAFYSSDNPNKKNVVSIFKNLHETQIAYEKTAENTQVLEFIKSNRTYNPLTYEDLTTYSNNLKSHYFDHIDFNNELLQSSEFLTERVLAYIYALPQEKSAYNEAVDKIVDAVGENNIAKMNLLEAIWTAMLESENDAVANYISDTYLLDLAKENNNELLIEVLEEFKNTAIGNKAVDFKFSYILDGKTVNTSLYELESTNKYLLIFWSSTCSHCLEELPKVKALMKAYPDINIIAYGLENDVRNWKKTITQFPEFLNTYDLAKWDSPTVKSYGVHATPSFFVLDKNKTILDKPENVDDLKNYLEN